MVLKPDLTPYSAEGREGERRHNTVYKGSQAQRERKTLSECIKEGQLDTGDIRVGQAMKGNLSMTKYNRTQNKNDEDKA